MREVKAQHTIMTQRSPTITDAERTRCLAAAYRIILECTRRAQSKTADREGLAGNTRTPASTSDASRCRHQLTPKLARAQVAEG